MLFSKLTIVSGGQTGADRAALDFAIAHSIPHDGWCPNGRLAEDGPIAPHYLLCETPTSGYAERTEWNVRDTDASVVFAIERPLRGGTKLTVDLARKHIKPCLTIVQQELPLWGSSEVTRQLAERLVDFIRKHDIRRLNVAGPRASQQPAIGMFVSSVLSSAYSQSQESMEIDQA